MFKKSPIVIIEDDEDDREILELLLIELGFEQRLHFFDSCRKALAYLLSTTEQPLVILSDINMPGMSGIELKKAINENKVLREKAVPFIFLTTTSEQETIKHVYEMMVQGFFVKPSSITDLKQMMKMILDYWSICKHPNSGTR